jgi:hypothetical protein
MLALGRRPTLDERHCQKIADESRGGALSVATESRAAHYDRGASMTACNYGPLAKV